jgi:uncharacterized phiE125 gp8 family phage protein
MIKQVPKTPAAVEAVTLEEVKLHCRVTQTAEDSNIQEMLTAAIEVCQRLTSRQFVNATWEDEFDAFPAKELELGRWPLTTKPVITYIDENGAPQTWTASLYQADTTAEPPLVKPVPGGSWPSTQADRYAAVTVEYVAGYGTTAESVPEHFKRAIKFLVCHWYWHREAFVSGEVPKEVEGTLRLILGMDRVRTF